MNQSLGIFYSCYKEKNAIDYSIKELRAHYPDAPIYLVSDGGLDYSYLSRKYSNLFVSLEEDTMSDTFKITDVNFREPVHQNNIKICVLALLSRLKRAIEFCNTEYILMMDPDTLVRGVLTIPDNGKLLGSKINSGFPEGIHKILSDVNGAVDIDSWGATPAIFEVSTFLKVCDKLTDEILTRFISEFYAIYAHDVLLPLLFSLVGEEEQVNSEITECNRDINWKVNSKPLVHQYREKYDTSSVTLVTSLYNLSNITRGDNRNWNDYLTWFKKTLSINSNLLIFTEPEVSPIIREVREGKNTAIAETGLEGIPYFKYLETIQNILDSDFYKDRMQDSTRIECREAIYSIVQYSKFKWLSRATILNPFDTQYFFWIDAGISRFLTDDDYKDEFPSQEALSQLKYLDDTILIQYNNDYYPDLINSRILPKSYFWDNRSFVCGSMFGGNETAILELSSEIDTILKFTINEHCVNNEQIALGYLTKIREDLFSLFYRTDSTKHLELFTELA